MSACESSKIYTLIIILLHAKCITLLLFHPGLEPALAELKFCFFCFFCIVHIQTESLLSTNTVIVLRSYTDYHAYTGIKPDFSYEKPWYNLYYKHGLEVN